MSKTWARRYDKFMSVHCRGPLGVCLVSVRRPLGVCLMPVRRLLGVCLECAHQKNALFAYITNFSYLCSLNTGTTQSRYDNNCILRHLKSRRGIVPAVDPAGIRFHWTL